ncbi:MAG: FAD-dependent oxidoreductase [Deltaproteobacteria bacterium]|nr:FAD-dependent oxidoreductase [Deltaproteobacteria bacterium]
MKKHVIVGGVAGGATAAAKLRREDEQSEITIFERGGYVSFANCGLPYFIGKEITNRDDLLLMTPELFWAKYRVRVFTHHEVIHINRNNKTVTVRNNNQQHEYHYDTLILSQGAMPIMPPLEGIKLPHVFSLRNMTDMDCIHMYLEDHQPKKAVVIGGGFIGLEMAEAFHHRGLSVTIVEMQPHILPPLDQDMALLFTESIRREGFNIITHHAVKKIYEHSVVLDDDQKIDADIVLVSAGVRAELELAKAAGLETGRLGGVLVNDYLQTTDPAIFAVGDMIEIRNRVTNVSCRIPLAGPANRQGRIAAINAAGGRTSYRGALGTSIVKVFDQTAAMTGITEKAARQGSADCLSTMTFNDSHAEYYPGAKGVRTKIVFQKDTGTLLGAQVIGGDGVDKRIDVLATAIYSHLTVCDLEEIDFAYAPPFGAANDAINIAGFVGSHVLKKEVRVINLPSECPPESQIIDVRMPDEIKTTGLLKGAINMPFPEIRAHLDKINRDKPVVVYCAKGQRGYYVYQILKNNGFKNIYNINGGLPGARAKGWEIVK